MPNALGMLPDSIVSSMYSVSSSSRSPSSSGMLPVSGLPVSHRFFKFVRLPKDVGMPPVSLFGVGLWDPEYALSDSVSNSVRLPSSDGIVPVKLARSRLRSLSLSRLPKSA